MTAIVPMSQVIDIGRQIVEGKVCGRVAVEIG